MSVMVILIAASLLVAGGFLLAFIWAVRNDQYQDLISPSMRILFDNDSAGRNKRENKTTLG